MTNLILDQIMADAQAMVVAKLKAYKVLNKYSGEAKDRYIEWRYSEEGSKLVAAQLEKIGYCCPVCGDNLKETTATVDHLQPKSRYFHEATDQSNFLVMCYPCNLSKSDSEFPKWRKRLPALRRQSLDYAISLIHGKTKLEELIE